MIRIKFEKLSIFLKKDQLNVLSFVSLVKTGVNCFQKVLCLYCNIYSQFPKSCIWHVPQIQ